MSGTIYELKDEKNWFIGKWHGHNTLVSLEGLLGPDLERLNQLFISLIDSQVNEDSSHIGYTVTVISKETDLSLIQFVVNMINQELGRHLLVKPYQGAILVEEADRLLAVHLPKDGLKKEAFFMGNSDQMDTILIATHNKGKTAEFKEMFGKLGYNVEDLNNYPELPEVEETGMTFEENARLKAETISQLTGKMVLADDSGLKVDVLGGLPGVWSARFSGPGATDDKNNAKLLHELAMVFDQKDRSAQFHSTLVVAAPDRESLVVEADWPGYIAFQPKGEFGFGYDPLFLVGETGKHSAELKPEEKNKISHRGQAVQKLVEVFPSWLAKQ